MSGRRAETPRRPACTTPAPARPGSFAVPVVQLRLVGDEADVSVVLRPDPELAAIRVLDDDERSLRREDDESHRGVGLVRNLVRPGRPLREHGDVTRLELPLAVGRPE